MCRDKRLLVAPRALALAVLFGACALVSFGIAAQQTPAVASDTPADTDSGAGAQSASGPEARDVVSGLVAALEAAAASAVDSQLRFEQLLPVVRSSHDLPFIAQLTIRRQWRDMSANDRADFVAAFEALSTMTYATRFEGLSEGSFRVLESALLDEGRVEVATEIVREDGDPVPIEFLLQIDDEGDPRIINIVADGVSDLALKRAQYQRVFREGGSVADLIESIEAETAGL